MITNNRTAPIFNDFLKNEEENIEYSTLGYPLLTEKQKDQLPVEFNLIKGRQTWENIGLQAIHSTLGELLKYSPQSLSIFYKMLINEEYHMAVAQFFAEKAIKDGDPHRLQRMYQQNGVIDGISFKTWLDLGEKPLPNYLKTLVKAKTRRKEKKDKNLLGIVTEDPCSFIPSMLENGSSPLKDALSTPNGWQKWILYTESLHNGIFKRHVYEINKNNTDWGKKEALQNFYDVKNLFIEYKLDHILNAPNFGRALVYGKENVMLFCNLYTKHKNKINTFCKKNASIGMDLFDNFLDLLRYDNKTELLEILDEVLTELDTEKEINQIVKAQLFTNKILFNLKYKLAKKTGKPQDDKEKMWNERKPFVFYEKFITAKAQEEYERYNLLAMFHHLGKIHTFPSAHGSAGYPIIKYTDDSISKAAIEAFHANKTEKHNVNVKELTEIANWTKLDSYLQNAGGPKAFLALYLKQPAKKRKIWRELISETQEFPTKIAIELLKNPSEEKIKKALAIRHELKQKITDMHISNISGLYESCFFAEENEKEKFWKFLEKFKGNPEKVMKELQKIYLNDDSERRNTIEQNFSTTSIQLIRIGNKVLEENNKRILRRRGNSGYIYNLLASTKKEQQSYIKLLINVEKELQKLPITLFEYVRRSKSQEKVIKQLKEIKTYIPLINSEYILDLFKQKEDYQQNLVQLSQEQQGFLQESDLSGISQTNLPVIISIQTSTTLSRVKKVLQNMPEDKTIPEIPKAFQKSQIFEVRLNKSPALTENETNIVKKIITLVKGKGMLPAPSKKMSFWLKILHFLSYSEKNLETHNYTGTPLFKEVQEIIAFLTSHVKKYQNYEDLCTNKEESSNELEVAEQMLIKIKHGKKKQQLIEEINKNLQHSNIVNMLVNLTERNKILGEKLLMLVLIQGVFLEHGELGLTFEEHDIDANETKLRVSSIMELIDELKVYVNEKWANEPILLQKLHKHIAYYTKSEMFNAYMKRKAQMESNKAMKLQIVGIKNEVDLLYGKDTCVNQPNEIFEEDFIPLRLLNKTADQLIGNVWLKEVNDKVHGKGIIITDIHPLKKYRMGIEPKDIYENVVDYVINQAKEDGIYKFIAFTTKSSAISNDPMLKKYISTRHKGKTPIKMTKKVCFPNGETDISDCVLITKF